MRGATCLTCGAFVPIGLGLDLDEGLCICPMCDTDDEEGFSEAEDDFEAEQPMLDDWKSPLSSHVYKSLPRKALLK